MALFTVRIQLRGDRLAADYDHLHDAMEAAGYRRTVTDDTTRAVYHLPHGEYAEESEASPSVIRAEAYAIAASIRANPMVLVTAGSRHWRGLDPA
jgi:hypothetical protein